MTSPIFIDANIPIYAAGAAHPLKEPCRQVVLLASQKSEVLFSNAEVLQELLHRSLSLRTWRGGGSATFREFATAMRGWTEPILAEDVILAATLADEVSGPSSRDLVHVAVMRRLGCQRIVTADAALDVVPGIERLDPAEIDSWRDRVLADA